jgi:uncharacterized membrane protein
MTSTATADANRPLEFSPERKAAARTAVSKERVVSVDVLRGVVMILMALDHTRDFFSNLRFQPENLAKSTPLLFLTRWVTHFCAPLFFFLAGVGASLAMKNGRSRSDVSRFLLTRGLFLVILEPTLLQIEWNFAFGPPFILLVIWALGWSMVVLSAMIYLPHKVIAAISLLIIFGHNLLDTVTPESLGQLAPVWHVLHVPGVVMSNVIVGYPLIPWVGVMSLGFVIGDVFRWDVASRRKFLIRAGASAIMLFLVLRYFNAYGNPFPWSSERNAAMTVASFFNVLKYPPSLMYLLMTLGPGLIALALLENARGQISRIVSVYGKVPMFYYMVHIFLIHSLAALFAIVQGGHAGFLSLDVGSFPAWYGTSLPGVYLAWVTVVAILYVPCRWYAGLKARRNDFWLRYI